MSILALDVSTSTVGVCIVDETIVPDGTGNHVLLLDRIEFKGKLGDTLWTKADHVCASLLNFTSAVPCLGSEISRVVLEEPLIGFRPGMSSAQTISTLMRFNGIVSYIARNLFDCEPEYIGSGHARKLCGIKLQKTAIGGPQKEQVFSHMRAHDLSYVVWPKKKSGQDVDWSRDACDAYVIARAATVAGKVTAPVKPKKKK